MSQSIDHHQLIKTLGRAGLIPFVLLALMLRAIQYLDFLMRQ